jgi:hypothetical protein
MNVTVLPTCSGHVIFLKGYINTDMAMWPYARVYTILKNDNPWSDFTRKLLDP